ncbi:hypothetical protein ACFQEX_09285 [Roseibium salinum]
MLDVIADAMKREFPPHLNSFRDVRDRQHRFLIAAFVGDRPCAYTIDLVYSQTGYVFRRGNHIMGETLQPLRIPPPVGLAGSGAACLERQTDWVRPTLSLVNAYNKKKISAVTVADQLARVAYFSHTEERKTVGPGSIVIWRNSKKGLQKGGGSQLYYANNKSASASSNVPSIMRGWDMSATSDVLMRHVTPHLKKMLEAAQKGAPKPNLDGLEEDINKELSQLPSDPDDKLC